MINGWVSFSLCTWFNACDSIVTCKKLKGKTRATRKWLMRNLWVTHEYMLPCRWTVLYFMLSDLKERSYAISLLTKFEWALYASNFTLITCNSVSSFQMLNWNTDAHLCMHLCEDIKKWHHTSRDNMYLVAVAYIHMWQIDIRKSGICNED